MTADLQPCFHRCLFACLSSSILLHLVQLVWSLQHPCYTLHCSSHCLPTRLFHSVLQWWERQVVCQHFWAERRKTLINLLQAENPLISETDTWLCDIVWHIIQNRYPWVLASLICFFFLHSLTLQLVIRCCAVVCPASAFFFFWHTSGIYTIVLHVKLNSNTCF